MTAKERLLLWKRRYITWGNLIRALIILIMLALAFYGLNLGYRYRVRSASTWSEWEYFLINLGPELAGIVVGVIIIDALNGWRQTQQLKAQLIRQMGSSQEDVAIPAVRELDHHGWLKDGSLKKAYLEGANLAGAVLADANMEEARLGMVQLMHSNLKGIHLERAILARADLSAAYLSGAHLQGANLAGTNLQGADMLGADLAGTNLGEQSFDVTGSPFEPKFLRSGQLPLAEQYVRFTILGANLEGVISMTAHQLRSARNVSGAIMPDGTKLKEDLGTYRDGPTLEEWLVTNPDCLLSDKLLEAHVRLANEGPVPVPVEFRIVRADEEE